MGCQALMGPGVRPKAQQRLRSPGKWSLQKRGGMTPSPRGLCESDDVSRWLRSLGYGVQSRKSKVCTNVGNRGGRGSKRKVSASRNIKGAA